MASLYWLGGTTAVPQVDTFTPATVEIGDIFTLTATDEAAATIVAINFTATVATAANAAAGLVAAWNASATAAAIATASGTVTVVLTAVTSGVPFYVAGTTTDGGGANTQTLARVATTPSKGPNDWNTASNWSSAAKPVAADDVTIDARGASYSILYGLNQSSITLTSLNTYMGAPAIGTTSYMLKISATTSNLNMPANSGTSYSGNFSAFNFGSVVTTANVFGSGATGSNGLQPVVLAGTHASNVLNLYGGICGIGVFTPGQSSTFATINAEKGTLTMGTGTGWTTLTNNGATVYLTAAGSTTLTNIAGKTTVWGTATLATVNAWGGTVYLNNRTTCVTAINLNGGIIDCSGNTAVFTMTTPTVQELGGTLIMASPTQGTFTNKFALSLTTNTKLEFALS